MPAPRLALLAPSLDLPDWAARQIIERHRATLPDLSQVTLVVPGATLLRPLRERLLHHAGGALLGPQLLTLSAFADTAASRPALSALDCRLRLAQALAAYPQLFGGHDALALAEDFYTLFESLAANTAELAQDPERFIARVLRGYGADLGPLSQEAQLVHTLWRAWLEDSEGRSPGAVQAQRLAAACAQAGGALCFIGFDQFDTATAAALRPALQKENVHLWLQGCLSGRDGAAMRTLCAQLRIEPEIVGAEPGWFDALFAEGAPLPQRLQGRAAPAGLRVQAARDAGHEARIADLAIRRWLIAGKRDIAVISQDRRFARRLRALLERAGVPLRDEAGWALSTSSAASALQHWLDCLDQNFSFRPLLALLRSEFLDPGAAQAQGVDLLERALYDQQVASGLPRFMALGDTATQLLQPLAQAAEHVVLHGGPRPAAEWSTQLQRSLQALPLWQQWTLDHAGARLVQLLQELDASLTRSALKLSWTEFRNLLRRLLEQASFVPEADEGPVRLLTLEQLGAQRCDALILAGASAGAFPGGAPVASLFNQSVRAELGLPHWAQQQEIALVRFRQLLEAAPECLISYAPQSEGEEALPCAWVELLLAAGISGDAELARLAASGAADITQHAAHTLAPPPAPKPSALPDLLPASLSAGAHQALIDCPYRFHAASCLGLDQPEPPDQPYSRRDFGESVHAVLSRFTASVKEAERAATEQRLREVAREQFAGELRARILTRAWLAEFEELVPEIVGWLIERSAAWPRAEAEASVRTPLNAASSLHGRLDRLETAPDGQHSVVDYKTGDAPRGADITLGEQVQATHYALLLENCTRVEYLRLKRGGFKSTVVEGTELADARDGVGQRVFDLLNALHGGAPLPAHGDALSCERCDFSGLCRKGGWADG